MALPTLEHTWRFKANQAFATSSNALTDNRTLLLGIKNALISSANWTDSDGYATTLSNSWTVVASSNSSTADTNDNWSTINDLVWSTGNHSWIVLRQNKINNQNVELCIDLNVVAASGYLLSLISSFGSGFDVSSPSISSRPTAPDQVIHLSGNSWLTGATVAFSSVLNIQISEDGYCNRLWVYIAAGMKCFWQFDRPINTVNGWTDPAINTVCSAAAATYTTLNDAAIGYVRATNYFGTTMNAPCYYATDFYVAGAFGERQTVVNSINSEWAITTISLACATAGLYGRHGTLSDIWFGSTQPGNGDCYPASGTIRQFVQTGDLILPWNQSEPVTT